MSTLVCDASVALKWLHVDGESEVEAARSLLAAHRVGGLRLVLLDLTYYEIANSLLRGRRAPTNTVLAGVSLLRRLCGDGAPFTARLVKRSIELAAEHGLTVYDAAYWGLAEAIGAPLVTADRELLAVGAGQSATEIAAELGLPT